MRSVALPSGEKIPVLGQGTWRMGEDDRAAQTEAAVLRQGLDLGMTLIDTAEMYGSGGAEEVVAQALAGRRDEAFLVSKVLPDNASRAGTVAAAERSLKRLKTDVIDLYLLHWRGRHPLSGTLEAFAQLQAAGKIRHWGVSNFDPKDMADLERAGGHDCATNQVIYNLGRRGIEWDLLPAAVSVGMPVMAYSPLEQGRLAGKPALAEVARRHGVTPLQVALAWVLARPGVIAIPKTARLDRLAENRAALDLVLQPDDFAALDRAFPPPRKAEPLSML